MKESALLLFEPDFPCWDSETFELAGETKDTFNELKEAGFLEYSGKGAVLTEKGLKARRKVSENLYIKAREIPPFNPEESLWNNRLYLLMERAFTGRYSIKDYSVNETLRYFPELSPEEIYTEKNGQISYVWRENRKVIKFLSEFPRSGRSARGSDLYNPEVFTLWEKKNRVRNGDLNFNLILRSHYDFEAYRKEKLPETDIYRLVNTDRYFFTRISSENYDDFYEKAGKLQIFLMNQRHLYIPGFDQFDSKEQENFNILTAVTDTEEELGKAAAEIREKAASAIEIQPPLFITGTSVERLRLKQKKKETVYDWFAEDTLHILRPDL